MAACIIRAVWLLAYTAIIAAKSIGHAGAFRVEHAAATIANAIAIFAFVTGPSAGGFTTELARYTKKFRILNEVAGARASVTAHGIAIIAGFVVVAKAIAAHHLVARLKLGAAVAVTVQPHQKFN